MSSSAHSLHIILYIDLPWCCPSGCGDRSAEKVTHCGQASAWGPVSDGQCGHGQGWHWQSAQGHQGAMGQSEQRSVGFFLVFSLSFVWNSALVWQQLTSGLLYLDCLVLLFLNEVLLIQYYQGGFLGFFLTFGAIDWTCLQAGDWLVPGMSDGNQEILSRIVTKLHVFINKQRNISEPLTELAYKQLTDWFLVWVMQTKRFYSRIVTKLHVFMNKQKHLIAGSTLYWVRIFRPCIECTSCSRGDLQRPVEKSTNHGCLVMQRRARGEKIWDWPEEMKKIDVADKVLPRPPTPQQKKEDFLQNVSLHLCKSVSHFLSSVQPENTCDTCQLTSWCCWHIAIWSNITCQLTSWFCWHIVIWSNITCQLSSWFCWHILTWSSTDCTDLPMFLCVSCDGPVRPTGGPEPAPGGSTRHTGRGQQRPHQVGGQDGRPQ